jgi:hypothetical protein
MNDVNFYNNCGMFSDHLPADSVIPYTAQLREARNIMFKFRDFLQMVVYKYNTKTEVYPVCWTATSEK